MNTHADKAKEKESQSVAVADTRLQSDVESTFQFVDNKPEAVTQRKLQEVVNNSPQVLQADQLQVIADNHFAQQQSPKISEQTIQTKENKTVLPDKLNSETPSARLAYNAPLQRQIIVNEVEYKTQNAVMQFIAKAGYKDLAYKLDDEDWEQIDTWIEEHKKFESAREIIIELGYPDPDAEQTLTIGDQEHELEAIKTLIKNAIHKDPDSEDLALIERLMEDEEEFANLQKLLSRLGLTDGDSSGSEVEFEDEDEDSYDDLVYGFKMFPEGEVQGNVLNKKYEQGSSVRGKGMDYRTSDKEAFSIVGDKSKVLLIRLYKVGGSGNLQEEFDFLKKYAKTIPTAEVFEIGVYVLKGDPYPAIVMKRYEGSSKEMVRHNSKKGTHRVDDYAESCSRLIKNEQMCKNALTSLQEIYGALPKMGGIEDIQFLIDKDGSFVVNDANATDEKHLDSNYEVVKMLIEIVKNRFKQIQKQSDEQSDDDEKEEKYEKGSYEQKNKGQKDDLFKFSVADLRDTVVVGNVSYNPQTRGIRDLGQCFWDTMRLTFDENELQEAAANAKVEYDKAITTGEIAQVLAALGTIKSTSYCLMLDELDLMKLKLIRSTKIGDGITQLHMGTFNDQKTGLGHYVPPL